MPVSRLKQFDQASRHLCITQEFLQPLFGGFLASFCQHHLVRQYRQNHKRRCHLPIALLNWGITAVLPLPLAPPIKYNLIKFSSYYNSHMLSLLRHSAEKRAVSVQSIAYDRQHLHQTERCIHNSLRCLE